MTPMAAHNHSRRVSWRCRLRLLHDLRVSEVIKEHASDRITCMSHGIHRSEFKQPQKHTHIIQIEHPIATHIRSLIAVSEPTDELRYIKKVHLTV